MWSVYRLLVVRSSSLHFNTNRCLTFLMACHHIPSSLPASSNPRRMTQALSSGWMLSGYEYMLSVRYTKHTFSTITTDVCISHHALSLKEMGAVPGGAFRTFWEPVYRMSIPANRKIQSYHVHLLWCWIKANNNVKQYRILNCLSCCTYKFQTFDLIRYYTLLVHV